MPNRLRRASRTFNPTKEQGDHLIEFADRLIFRGELWRRSKVWRRHITVIGAGAIALAEWGDHFVAALKTLLSAFGIM